MDNRRVDEIMRLLPSDWANRWCESQVCGCMGCANRSGGVVAQGVTKEDWQEWSKRNSQPITPDDPATWSGGE